MDIKSKEGIADFIEANLKELGGDAYGVDYVAEKLWEWHAREIKKLNSQMFTINIGHEDCVIQHLINETYQVVGKDTGTVWKQGTMEECNDWVMF